MAVRADPDLLGATHARPAMQSDHQRDRKSVLRVKQLFLIGRRQPDPMSTTDGGTNGWL